MKKSRYLLDKEYFEGFCVYKEDNGFKIKEEKKMEQNGEARHNGLHRSIERSRLGQ